ncbi:MAG: hypothetical protein M0D57_06710 [Sphingobacteriales bacterium JAD_PAG50586_3]|nr:MAG: hypothetical protein M0D57_06710 [Sphingobacteriales bacterium JAD_PAG50586_3]
MKKLLPILFIMLALSACKKDKSEDDINPGYIIAGDANTASNKTVQLLDTTYYEHEILLFDEFKIKVHYTYHSWFGGGQSQIIIKLIPPTNIEYASADGLSLVKRIMPDDTISSNLTWKAFEDNNSAIMLDRLSGPLANETNGDWPTQNEGYIGIRVFKNNHYYYGWVKLRIAGGWYPPTALQLLGWAIYHD